MDRITKKNLGWERRHQRTRRKVRGSAERPRLSVYRSLKHLYVQLIDDEAGCTLAALSTMSSELGQEKKGGKSLCTTEMARKVGQRLSELAKEKKISKVVFDKAGYQYHGKIKVLAEAAREGGLQF